tara:strand:- start:177 stop:695 length:519 start_codon:yes stop_codon:yes gene_type:complete
MTDAAGEPPKEEGSWPQIPQHPNEKLAQKLAQDWAWAKEAATTYNEEGSTRLRKMVVSGREMVTSVMSVRTSVQSAVEGGMSLAEPPESVRKYKDSLFDLRRKYPWAIVGGVTLLAMVPGLVLRQATRMEKARLVLRNAFVGGGAAAVLLYPEFVLAAAKKVEAQAAKRREA